MLEAAFIHVIKNMFAFFSLRSIRGRFLITALSFIVYLLIMASVAQYMVGKTAFESIENSKQHRDVKQYIQRITDKISKLNLLLQRFLISPSDAVGKEIYDATSTISGALETMLAFQWIRHNHAEQAAARNIGLLFGRLSAEIKRLLEVRDNPRLLFPASSTLENIMLPANSSFILQLELAISEAEELKQGAIRVKLEDLRFTWVRMIGAFRVYIAARFGIFPALENTPRDAQRLNIETYAAHINSLLSSLRKDYDQLGFQQQHSLDEMQIQFQHWKLGFTEAAKLYNSNNWRRDIPMLNEISNPLFLKIWSNIQFIEENIDKSAENDLENLSTTSSLLSMFFWAIAAIGISLTIFGIFFFDTFIRKPLSYVSHALNAQANGTVIAATMEGSTTETRYLFSAFEHMQHEVNKRQQRLQAILDYAAEGIFTLDSQGVIESANKAMQRLFGYDENYLHGRSIDTLIIDFPRRFLSADSKANDLGNEVELTAQQHSGQCIPVAVVLSEFTLQGRQMYIGLVADISERRAFIKHLQYVAEHDGLTHLKNRTYFQQRLQATIAATQQQQNHALLYVDLDNFNYINDTLSHAAGDTLLQDVVANMQEVVPADALLARFGGDEFTILFRTQDAPGAQQVAEGIRAAIASRNFYPQGRQISLTCSIGAVFIDQSIIDSESALSKADLACHVAKRQGRNRVHLFNTQNQTDVSSMENDMSWSRTIKMALQENRFLLALQPIIDIGTRRVHSYEVLIRLLDEKGHVLLPGGFLPVAERYGLATDIDKWVIQHALRALGDLHMRHKKCRFNLNLSGQTITDYAVVDIIRQTLHDNSLDPSWITFEVTETIAIENMQAAQKILCQIQNLGCSTALDDFGVGMSSFAYLQDLPVNTVKIDGRFIQDIAENEVNRALVRAMTDVAHALHKVTVAEFVQNERSMQLLELIGVDYAQGFYLGKPELVKDIVILDEAV